jgi:hypothetical protein
MKLLCVGKIIMRPNSVSIEFRKRIKQNTVKTSYAKMERK